MNSKQIENIIKLDAKARYDYFIKKVADFEELWTIVDSHGKYVIASIDDKKLISFWSAEEFIASNIIDEWADCVPSRLTLDNLADTVLDYIVNNQLSINIFPINGNSGFVVDIEEFSTDLNEELKKYK